jgi:sRNA-binding carbon storage regulator CsrA
VLVVSRKEHESIRIEPVEGLDPSMTLREAFAHGPILVKLFHIGYKRVRLAIEAPSPLRVRRGDTPTVNTETSCSGAPAAGHRPRPAGI